MRVTEHWPTLPRVCGISLFEDFQKLLEVQTPTIMLFCDLSLSLSLSLSFYHQYCKLIGNTNRNFILPVDFCDENHKVVTEEYDAQKEKYYLK